MSAKWGRNVVNKLTWRRLLTSSAICGFASNAGTRARDSPGGLTCGVHAPTNLTVGRLIIGALIVFRLIVGCLSVGRRSVGSFGQGCRGLDE